MTDTTMNPMQRGISFGVGMAVTFLVVYLLDIYLIKGTVIPDILGILEGLGILGILRILPSGFLIVAVFDLVCIFISAFLGAWWGTHISRKGWISLGLFKSTFIGFISAVIVSILFLGTAGQWLLGTFLVDTLVPTLFGHLYLVAVLFVIFLGFSAMMGSREMGGPLGILLGLLLIHGMPLVVLLFTLGLAPMADPFLRKYLMSAASFSLSYWLTALAATFGL